MVNEECNGAGTNLYKATNINTAAAHPHQVPVQIMANAILTMIARTSCIHDTEKSYNIALLQLVVFQGTHLFVMFFIVAIII